MYYLKEGNWGDRGRERREYILCVVEVDKIGEFQYNWQILRK